MGLKDFVNKIKEQEAIKEKETQLIKNNPRFAEMDISKIEFHPIDGDKDRMTIYGCYAGDSFTYKGKTYTVEKDDVERLTFKPVFERVGYKEYQRGKKVPKDVKAKWDKAEREAHKRMYRGEFVPGDEVKSKTYRFRYRSQELTEEYGQGGMLSRTIGYLNGWDIRCVDKKTPMKDVVMPDSFLGAPVEFANNCFKDCMNVASVAHISFGALANSETYDMFSDSGLREVPKQLLDGSVYQLERACRSAKALHQSEKVHDMITAKTHGWGGRAGLFLYSTRDELRKNIKMLKERKTELSESVRGEFSPYVKAEKVEFVYNFKPVTLYRGQTVDGALFVVKPDGPEKKDYGQYYSDRVMVHHDGFDGYMSRFKQDRIQGLTQDSIKTIPLDELADAIEASMDIAIRDCEDRLEKEMERINGIKEKSIAEAEAAQQGLGYTPKDFEPNKENESNTRDTHEEEIE